MEQNEPKGLNISTKSFLTAIIVIFILMVLTYGLTFVVPGGEYARVDGKIDMTAGFQSVEGGISFVKWICSPILVLTASGSGTLIAVIAFLLVIGGIFNALDKCGLMRYMLNKTAHKFSGVRYRLLAVVTLLFMAMGAMIGSFEEAVPLVPIVVALSISLGWDTLVGLGMSLLAIGCGFSSGVCNPFTVGVAQEVAGLAMFSGIWMRLLSFALIYGLLMVFLYFYAKKVERPIAQTVAKDGFIANPKMDKGLTAFVVILGIGIVAIFSSSFISVLQDYTMIIVAVMFLAAGITSTLLCGMSGKDLGKDFLRGLVTIMPAVLMILMASSIRYTMEEAKILDALLHKAVNLTGNMPRWLVIEFIYLLVLGMNFFIPSGSAKAFMLIPLIVPVAQQVGISPQLCVLAFAFGDGFSNVFYPTNPVLLISLGLTDVSYGKWFKWSGKFQLANLILTSLLLQLALVVGYH